MSKGSDSKFENPILGTIDDKLGGLLAETSSEEDFSGKAGQLIVLRLPGLGFRRIFLVGLGPCAPYNTTAAYRGIGEAVAAAAKSVQASSAAIVLASSEENSEESKLKAASAIASGKFMYLIYTLAFAPITLVYELLKNFMLPTPPTTYSLPASLFSSHET